MPMQNNYELEFIESVCNEVRCKSVHDYISKELSDHIKDQKNKYITQGFNQETAELKAVEQMGDPVLIGRQLDKAHRPKNEWSILLIAAILVIGGGIIQYLISGASVYTENSFSHFLVYAPIGIAVFFVIYFFDYTIFVRHSKLICLAFLVFFIAGFFILKEINGAYQHVYCLAILFIPAFAGIIYSFRDRGYLGIVFSGLFYATAAFMCIMSASLSVLVLFTAACLFILTATILKGYFGGNKRISLALVYVPTILTFCFITLLSGVMGHYKLIRFISMFNPVQDQTGYGWQTNMVRQLLSSSKPIGSATPGGNTPIELLLPGWSTDFTLTYVIAKLGFLAGMSIIAIMTILIVRMFMSVLKQKSTCGYLISLSACLTITVQTVLYVLSNTGVIAPFHTFLPLISFGAFGFIVNMAIIALLLSVHRRTNIVFDRFQNIKSNTRLFTISDGKLIIDLSLFPKKSL